MHRRMHQLHKKKESIVWLVVCCECAHLAQPNTLAGLRVVRRTVLLIRRVHRTFRIFELYPTAISPTKKNV